MRTWGRVALAAGALTAVVGLSACGLLEEASTAGGPRATEGPTVDAEELVAELWGLLNAAGQLEMCDMYEQVGDDAGTLFIAGLEANPVADRLTDEDHDAIRKAGAGLLRDYC